jgi:hypothetical protein
LKCYASEVTVDTNFIHIEAAERQNIERKNMVRATLSRSINPLLLAPLLAIKKFTVLKAAQQYGWHRVYRRLCEGIELTVPAENQDAVRGSIKLSMRFPNQGMQAVQDSGVIDFAKNYTDYIVKHSPVGLPPFLVTLAKTVASENPVVKMWSFFDGDRDRK